MGKPQRKYVVGNRPPQDLSPEAKKQLNQGHRSKAMDVMVQKASKGKVVIPKLNKELLISILVSPPRKKKRA